jgi:hypothetical protein
VVSYFVRESALPVVTSSCVVKVDTAHASLGCVHCAKQSELLGHDFCQVRGAAAEAGGKATKRGTDVALHKRVERTWFCPAWFWAHCRALNRPGDPGMARAMKRSFQRMLLHLLALDSLEALQAGEDFVERLLSVRGQLKGLASSVHYPAQY